LSCASPLARSSPLWGQNIVGINDGLVHDNGIVLLRDRQKIAIRIRRLSMIRADGLWGRWRAADPFVLWLVAVLLAIFSY